MQAIRTQFFGASNVRGSRIKATCAAKTITRSFDFSFNHEDNHRQVAIKLVESLQWVGDGYGQLFIGTLKDGSYVHVLSGRKAKPQRISDRGIGGTGSGA